MRIGNLRGTWVVDREKVEFHQGSRLPRGYRVHVAVDWSHTQLMGRSQSDSRSYTLTSLGSPTEPTTPLSEYPFYPLPPPDPRYLKFTTAYRHPPFSGDLDRQVRMPNLNPFAPQCPAETRMQNTHRCQGSAATTTAALPAKPAPPRRAQGQ